MSSVLGYFFIVHGLYYFRPLYLLSPGTRLEVPEAPGAQVRTALAPRLEAQGSNPRGSNGSPYVSNGERQGKESFPSSRTTPLIKGGPPQKKVSLQVSRKTSRKPKKSWGKAFLYLLDLGVMDFQNWVPIETRKIDV